MSEIDTHNRSGGMHILQMPLLIVLFGVSYIIAQKYFPARPETWVGVSMLFFIVPIAFGMMIVIVDALGGLNIKNAIHTRITSLYARFNKIPMVHAYNNVSPKEQIVFMFLYFALMVAVVAPFRFMPFDFAAVPATFFHILAAIVSLTVYALSLHGFLKYIRIKNEVKPRKS